MTIRDIFGTGVLYRLGLAVFASVAFAVFSNNDTVRAVTPEACFTFSSLNKSITGYLYDGVDCGVSVDIPSTIDSYEVLAIGNGAFSYKGIESVKIPGSVTSIGNGAFQQNKLSQVTLPAGVQSVGDVAFANNFITDVSVMGNPTSGLMLSTGITNTHLPSRTHSNFMSTYRQTHRS